MSYNQGQYKTINFRFAEAIVDYLSNIANAPDQTVTEANFAKEMDSAHEFLFLHWLSKSGGTSSSSVVAEFNVRHSVIEVRQSLKKITIRVHKLRNFNWPGLGSSNSVDLALAPIIYDCLF